MKINLQDHYSHETLLQEKFCPLYSTLRRQTEMDEDGGEIWMEWGAVAPSQVSKNVVIIIIIIWPAENKSSTDPPASPVTQMTDLSIEVSASLSSWFSFLRCVSVIL